MFVVRSASKNRTKLNTPVIWVLVLLVIFSFSRAFFPISYHDSELVAYYLPHLRFGELLIGAILAVAVSNSTKEISSTRANVVGSLGLLVLVICLTISFPNKTPWFPWFRCCHSLHSFCCCDLRRIGNELGEEYAFQSRCGVCGKNLLFSLFVALAFVGVLLITCWGKQLTPQVLAVVALLTVFDQHCFLLFHRATSSSSSMVFLSHWTGLLCFACACGRNAVYAGTENASCNGTICELWCNQRHREGSDIFYHRYAEQDTQCTYCWKFLYYATKKLFR